MSSAFCCSVAAAAYWPSSCRNSPSLAHSAEVRSWMACSLRESNSLNSSSTCWAPWTQGRQKRGKGGSERGAAGESQSGSVRGAAGGGGGVAGQTRRQGKASSQKGGRCRGVF
eukprot:3606785-Prymnesium_polylepis.1